jgi:hypothetical protein
VNPKTKSSLPPARDIPPERRTLYHFGQVLGLVGLLLFLSTFFSFAAGFGNFDGFEARTRSIMFRAIGGIVLMMVSGGVMNVAARGLAGSGMLLDPQRARREQEPWTRMQGGMLDDAIDEIVPGGVERVIDRLAPGEPGAEVIRVRCPKCRALNDEHARFCNQCAATL